MLESGKKGKITWSISPDIWALILCPPATWRNAKNCLCCWHHQDLCRGCWSVSFSKCPVLYLNSGINGDGGKTFKISHLVWILCLISCHQSIFRIIRSLKFWELFLPLKQGCQHAQPQKDVSLHSIFVFLYLH